MAQVDNIETIEKRLWGAADQLRANSNYASNEYFMPVMGLIFLRHAYSRFLAVKPEIEATLPKRGGKTRDLTKEDFSQKSSIFLQPNAQFDYLVSLSDDKNRAEAIVEAMESIEADYESLRGVLPKAEYQELDNAVLGQLLRTLNPEELKTAKGDVFGRIYEYFLTQFADQKAHDGGEFFTPVSLVSLIANVIEPTAGTVLDPACGSGGMFVQSASIVERRHENPSEKLTFRGMEKNATTIRLAKMNLAVHGLEGDIQKAITYYEDPHELLGKADYVMANPPFNVDEVDAEKVKNDPRLQFGLPGVNKQKKVSNGNYLWISYFYSYLKDGGRAGFVMSSQASSAGHGEKEVRRKIVESGDVDAMIAIRGNFFYTRSVPCELWFFNRAKPKHRKDHVLMLDARNVYRKVTRKVFDFTPEQLANITAITWLYRDQPERFLGLIAEYFAELDREAALVPDAFTPFDELTDKAAKQLDAFSKATKKLPGIDTAKHATVVDAFRELTDTSAAYVGDRDKLLKALADFSKKLGKAPPQASKTQHQLRTAFDPIAAELRGLVKQADLLYKLVARARDAANAFADDPSGTGDEPVAESVAEHFDKRALTRLIKDLDEVRKTLVDQLKLTAYFHKQIAWLQDRFPDADLVDVPGLVKVVSRAEIEDADWSLTPARYVGVAPIEEDEDFDFEESLRDIHIELTGLNDEASQLAKAIQKNFEEMGV
ncbi:MAG: N-6 DNA methylase [Phycisphaeraceae bacterium]|nr:N-6 DNA methylase [Phycisphaeraceae bacterium]